MDDHKKEEVMEAEQKFNSKIRHIEDLIKSLKNPVPVNVTEAGQRRTARTVGGVRESIMSD